MSATTKKQGRGRPALPMITKAKRWAILSIKNYNEIKSEYDLMLNISPRDKATGRANDVMQAAESRMVVSHEIESLNTLISGMSKSDGSLQELNSLKRKRSAKYNEYNSLPEVGYTFSEWLNAPSSQLKKELGRPKLSIETKLIRAEAEKNAALLFLNSILSDEGKEAVSEENIDSLGDSEHTHVEVGRPRLDNIGILDRKLKKIQDKIEHITSGKAAAEQEEKLKSAKRSAKTGKILGRPFENIDERLLSLREKEESIISEIQLLEFDLDEKGRVERELKITRDKLREHKSYMKLLKGSRNNDLVEAMSKLKQKIELKISKLIIDRDAFDDPVKKDTIIPRKSEKIPFVNINLVSKDVMQGTGSTTENIREKIVPITNKDAGPIRGIEHQDAVLVEATAPGELSEATEGTCQADYLIDKAFKAKLDEIQGKQKDEKDLFKSMQESEQAAKEKSISEKENLMKIIEEMNLDPDDVFHSKKVG